MFHIGNEGGLYGGRCLSRFTLGRQDCEDTYFQGRRLHCSGMPSIQNNSEFTFTDNASQLTQKAKAGARKVASISVPVAPATATSPVVSMSSSSSATDDKPKKRRGGKRIPMSVRRQRQREKEAAAKNAGATL